MSAAADPGKTNGHVHDRRGFACNHVVRRKRPVRIVAHGADGSWQFMCGKDTTPGRSRPNASASPACSKAPPRGSTAG